MILDEGSRENVCVAMKAFFEVRSFENSASRVTYQPQSDMIPRALGMWYIIYQMPQILFLLMADACGWNKKDEKWIFQREEMDSLLVYAFGELNSLKI